MSDFTIDDISKFFDRDYEEDSPFEDGIAEFWWEVNHRPSKTFNIFLNGETYEASLVEYYDDGREWTNHMHAIFVVDGRTFKFPGVFYSHDGSYWDVKNITEGTMQEKVVMVFE